MAPGARSVPGSHAFGPRAVFRARSVLVALSAGALFALPLLGTVAWLLHCVQGPADPAGAQPCSWLQPSCWLQGRGHSAAAARAAAREGKWAQFLRFTAINAAARARQGRLLGPLALGRGEGTVAEQFPADEWQHWQLPPRMLRHFAPRAARLDPHLFHLHLKVLVFDRVDSALRCLHALRAADYQDDAVSLEIFLDHPFHTTDGWGPLDASAAAAALARHGEVLAALDAFEWPHGPKTLLARSLNAGIQPQWMEAFWPESVNEFAFIVEDDTEVSPYFYGYLKRLIMQYYYTRANFNPKVWGISFQRQWFVPAKGGRKLESPAEPFLYPLVGTWGQIVFPIAWKEFRLWYDSSRYTAGHEPILGNMVTTDFWHRKRNSIWTHWQVHWTYIHGMYNLYTGFPGNLSLSVCYRTAGVNIKRTMGADTSMITFEVLQPGRSRPGAAGSNEKGGEPRDGAGAKAPALQAPLPRWWTHLPSMKDMAAFNFCFRPVPNVHSPATSLGSFRRLLPLFGAKKELAVLPMPAAVLTGSDASFSLWARLLRNWLCYMEALGQHNHALLFILLPPRDSTGHTCAGAQQRNQAIRDLAEEEAGRNHLVLLLDAAEARPIARARDPVHCVAVGESALSPRAASADPFLARPHAEVVGRLLGQGLDVLLTGVGTLWRAEPIACLRNGAQRHNLPAISRFLRVQDPAPAGSQVSGTIAWVEGSAAGSAAWAKCVELWDKHQVQPWASLPIEALEEARGLLYGKAPDLVPPGATTNECVVAAPWEAAAGAGPGAEHIPAVIMTPIEGGTDVLKKMALWQVNDLHNTCTAVYCKPYL